MPSKPNPVPADNADPAPTLTGIVPPAYHLPPPSLTLSRIKAAIPAHCFDRSAIMSTQYLLQDLAVLAALYWGASEVLEKWEGPWMANWAAWIVWQAVVGAVGFGVWIVAHECGHGAYSPYPLLNHTVGLIFHSVLLVPYFSWQLSHAKHHHFTGHHAFDEAFVPETRSGHLPGTKPKDKVVLAKEEDRSKVEREDHGFWATPLGCVVSLVAMWVIGFPWYLATHAQGRNYGRFTSHYIPTSPIYLPKQRHLILLSDLGVLAVLAGIGYWARVAGFAVVFKYYVVPYLWVNFWLTTVTLLQHTDTRLPHYAESTWTYVRGALCTVDRDYGILNWVFHNITDTHVVHHLFPTIPHYHATEATYHVRKLLESEGLYVHDDRNVVTSAYEVYRECRFIEDQGDVRFFRK